jgi:hypothetical protein
MAASSKVGGDVAIAAREVHAARNDITANVGRGQFELQTVAGGNRTGPPCARLAPDDREPFLEDLSSLLCSRRQHHS